MKNLIKSAAIVGVAGVLTLGSMTASEARNRAWVAGAAGFAVGAAIGAAAANAAYYNAGYYNGGYYAYEPAYAGPAYAYDSYAYSPTYVAPAVTMRACAGLRAAGAVPRPGVRLHRRSGLSHAAPGSTVPRRATTPTPPRRATALTSTAVATPTSRRRVCRATTIRAQATTATPIAPWQDWKLQGERLLERHRAQVRVLT